MPPPVDKDSERGRQDNDEGTFADVFNSFTFGGGRKARRKKREKGAERENGPESREPEPQRPPEGEDWRGEQDEPASAVVRPYAWTGGRTRSELVLELETLVSTSRYAKGESRRMQEEHFAIARMCVQPRSIAEIAALLSTPLSVARVLVGDMAELGLVEVSTNPTSDGASLPSIDLMDRVLAGLRRL